MTQRSTITRTVSVPGFSVSSAPAQTDDNLKRVTLKIDKGFECTLSTRTTDHSGQCVASDNHTVDTSDIVDIYSSTGAILAKNCTVSAVVGNLITFTGTAVSTGIPNTPGIEMVISPQQSVAFAITDTTKISVFAYGYKLSGAVPAGASAAVGHVRFVDPGNSLAEDHLVDLNADSLDYIYDIAAGDSLTIIASITTMKASNPLSTQKASVSVAALYSN